MEARLLYNSVKEYDDMIQIIVNKTPVAMPTNRHIGKRKQKKNPIVADSSIARTRTAVQDICLCNHFDWFCTFTFDPKRFNSKDIKECKRYMENWLKHCRDRRSKYLKYLVIPELHKSGAVHFHALLRGFEDKQLLRESHVFQNGRRVYNIRHWHFGFSTCVKIDNIDKVSSYIRKYITKDMILLPGTRRYLCSKGLTRPKKSVNQDVRDLIKNTDHFFYKNVTPDSEYYLIKKSDLPYSPKKLKQLELDLEIANALL